MAHHRAPPVDHYHSDDPRQLDLEHFIAQKAGAQEPVPTAGRPTVDLGLRGRNVVFRNPDFAIPDLDQLAREIVRLTGGTPMLTWMAPTDAPASLLVRVGWSSPGASPSRQGFFASSLEALRHVVEHERICAEQGREAADLFHARARCRSEAEAVAEMDERGGVERADPNRGDRRFINDQSNHNKRGGSR